jgi:AcrR family transcriptional regulator
VPVPSTAAQSGDRPYRGLALEDRRRDQRRRLVEAARDVFAERGFGPAGIDDIVGRARVSRTSFYEFFPSKEACLLAVFDEGMNVLRREVAAVVAQDQPDPVERIRAEVATLGRVFAGDPAMARIILIEIIGASPRAEEIRWATRREFAGIIDLQLAAYPQWAGRPEHERRLAAMSAMAAIAEPLTDLVARGRIADEWQDVVDPITRFCARALIPRSEFGGAPKTENTP